MDTPQELKAMLKLYNKKNFLKFKYIYEKINAGIIGFGIGQKHFEAIHNYKNSKVKIICEKNINKLNFLKKKFPKIKITNNENDIFLNRDINLVSIASYDNYHFAQIIKSIKYKKNFIVEKPLCLTQEQLNKIKKFISKTNLKFTSNLVLRVNNLSKKYKKKYLKIKYSILRLIIFGVEKKNYLVGDLKLMIIPLFLGQEFML